MRAFFLIISLFFVFMSINIKSKQISITTKHDSNTIKKTNINCQVKGEMLKLFKGSTYKLVYSMIFNIFYNVLKHATPKEIIISLTNNINGDLDISFKNKFNKC